MRSMLSLAFFIALTAKSIRCHFRRGSPVRSILFSDPLLH